VDLTLVPSDIRGIQYTQDGVTYTLPCGSPIPAGAVCVCNCVPGTYCPCVAHTTCTCQSYRPGGCTCVPVHYWYPG